MYDDKLKSHKLNLTNTIYEFDDYKFNKDTNLYLYKNNIIILTAGGKVQSTSPTPTPKNILVLKYEEEKNKEGIINEAAEEI